MQYHLAALITETIWGLTFVSTKVLLETFSPLWILLIRFAIGFLILCLIRPHILRARSKKDQLYFVFAGITGVACYYLLENVALVYTTATSVGVIVAAAPLFTVLLEALMGNRSSLHVPFFIGFAIALFGLILVAMGSEGTDLSSLFASSYAFGNLLALFATFVWALYSVLLKKISDRGYETIAVTKQTFFWGLVVILPATLLFGGAYPAADQAFELVNVGNLLFLGVIASAVCFITWGIAVKHLGASKASTYIYLDPVVTATASILILREPCNASIVLGIVLTIVGLIVSNSKKLVERKTAQNK